MVWPSREILSWIGRSIGPVVGIIWANGVARTVGRGDCCCFSRSVMVVSSSRMALAGVVSRASGVVCGKVWVCWVAVMRSFRPLGMV